MYLLRQYILLVSLVLFTLAPPLKAAEFTTNPAFLDSVKEIRGTWVGDWRCTSSLGFGSSGGFELEIISVKGEIVRGRGVWHNTVSGSFPFLFDGKIEGKNLVWQKDKDRWIKLSMEQLQKKKLDGQYSTIGNNNLYYGDISMGKKKSDTASYNDFSSLIGNWEEVDSEKPRLLTIIGYSLEDNMAILDVLYGIEKIEKVDAIAKMEKGVIKISLITPPKNFLFLSLKTLEAKPLLTGRLELRGKKEEKEINFSKAIIAQEVKLISIEVPPTVIAGAQYETIIKFKSQGRPIIKEVCFSWSGEGPYCRKPGEIKYDGKTIINKLITNNPGSYSLSGFIKYLKDGIEHKSNEVSCLLVVR